MRSAAPSSPDIAVIGAGVIGCACARSLAVRGARVTLIDAQTHSREASWAAGGMLAPHGEVVHCHAEGPNPLFELGRASLALYPRLREELLESTGVDIDLRWHGTLMPVLDDIDEERVARVAELLEAVGAEHRRLGIAEVRREEPMLAARARGALEVPDHSVDNRRLLEALAADCERRGVRLSLGTPVDRVERTGDRITAVHSRGEAFRAQEFVIAAGAWTQPIADLFRVDLPGAAVKGQMIRHRLRPEAIRRVIRRGSAYIVPRAGGDVVIGATTEFTNFDKGLTDEGVEDLRRDSVEMVPALARRPIAEHWCGLRPRLADGLPGLGRAPRWANLSVATGHYRNGILLTPITGEALAAVIFGETPPVDLAPFDPGRFR